MNYEAIAAMYFVGEYLFLQDDVYYSFNSVFLYSFEKALSGRLFKNNT